MRHLLATVVLVVLLLAGHASAQNWFGVRSGYPLGVTLHYGIADALANGADLRISGRLVAGGGSARFGIGVDGLVGVFAEGPANAYLGAGPSLEFGPGRADLGLQGLVGGQIRLVDVGLGQLGVFAEASLGGSVDLARGGARIPTFGAALGVNWYF